jgi:transmembrane sensor
VIPTDQEIRFAITQRAAEWFIAHRAAPLDEDARVAFLSWLKASPVHVEEYMRITAVERALAAAANNPEVVLEDLLQEAHANLEVTPLSSTFMVSGAPPPRTAGRRWLLVAAATALGVAMACWIVLRGSPGLGAAQTYSTAHGVQSTQRLDDGSVLHLNSDSAVTVRYSNRERLVDLDRGQAVFEVTRDALRPFRVTAGQVHLVALGTEFDVYRQGKTTAVTVIEGVVSVANELQSQPLRVERAQQVLIEAGVIPATASPANISQTEAWMQRRIVFDRRPLGQVAAEFNRYTPTPFVIEGELQQLPVSGMFHTDDPESFADFLASLEGVKVVRLPGQVRVSSSHQ